MSAPKVFRKAATARKSRLPVVARLLAAMCVITGCSPAVSQTSSPGVSAPQQPVKLIFIHHSCGENWLVDSHGGLGKALAENNYFVSDTNYGWGPDGIGDRTDITNWPEWFAGPQSRQSMQALYREGDQHCQYTRTVADPGGENQVVIFKSCFPNSNLEGNPTDAPARGEGLSVANAKAVYNEILKYFATRPDRLFVAVTAPPVQDRTYARNARAFNTWLVKDWLAGYRGNNVAVFDFYNVLTHTDNHHRLRGGKIEHTCRAGADTLSYPSDDDHPSVAGNRKATEEFVPLLNYYYNRWASTRPATKTAPTVQTQTDTTPAATAAETPAAVETPPQAQPPAATAGSVIDDFERDPQAWKPFLDTGKDTRLTFATDKKIKRGGAASLQIQYDVAPESWAACSLVYDRPQDWSRYQGLSLYVHAEKQGQPIVIVAYGGTSADNLLHFECEFQASQASIDGWQQIDVPWSRLKLPEWQGADTEKYNPRCAMGVAIAFHASPDARAQGKLWIDDIALSSKPSGAKPASSAKSQ